MNSLVASATLGLGLLLATPLAASENLDLAFLPRESRELPLSYSAATDAPVVQYGYGPRAQALIGGEIGVIESRDEEIAGRILADVVVGLDNADSHGPIPTELWRHRFEFGAVWAYLPAFTGFPGTFELFYSFGHTGADTLGDYRLSDAIEPTDIPFGGGGFYLGTEAALSQPLGPALTLVSRLGTRTFANALPQLVGAKGTSDAAAVGFNEGLAHAPYGELLLRGPNEAAIVPLLALRGQAFVPSDDSATAKVTVRGFLGLGVDGAAGEVVPFVATEIGAGPGLLINRQEARLALGVRYVAF